MERKRVGIVLFDNVEILDFCGPFEVFSATRLNEEKRREEPSPFEVLLVAEHPGPIVASGNLKVIPHHTFGNCPRFNILVVPGGWGTRKEVNNQPMLDWLRTRAPEVETLTSVCTESMLLGFAGLLNGHHATTHWQSLDWMRESFPAVTVEYGMHVVEDGRVITSAGISAGIDMALKVVARFFGADIARATARHMEYPYPDSNARRILHPDQVTARTGRRLASPDTSPSPRTLQRWCVVFGLGTRSGCGGRGWPREKTVYLSAELLYLDINI